MGKNAFFKGNNGIQVAGFSDDDDDDEDGGKGSLIFGNVLTKRVKRIGRMVRMDIRQAINDGYEEDRKRAKEKADNKLGEVMGSTNNAAVAAGAFAHAEVTAAHAKISTVIDAVEQSWSVTAGLAKVLSALITDVDAAGVLPGDAESTLKNGMVWINGKRWDLLAPLSSIVVNHTAVITDELPSDAVLMDRVYGPNPPSSFTFDAGRVAASAMGVSDGAPTATIDTVYDPAKHTHALVFKATPGKIEGATYVPIATLFPALAKGAAFPLAMPSGYYNPEGAGAYALAGLTATTAAACGTTVGLTLAKIRAQRISHDLAGTLTVLGTTGLAAATDLLGKLPVLFPDVVAGLIKRPGSTALTR